MKQSWVIGLLLVTLSLLGFFSSLVALHINAGSFASDADPYIRPGEKNWASYVDNRLPPVIQQGDPERYKIALSFDDGPIPGCTEPLLQVLRDFNIKATFFLVGSQVEKYPFLTKMIHEDGHEIGNHTYSHRRLINLNSSEIIAELENTRTAVFNQIGFIPILFRPPGGKFNMKSLSIAQKLNYSTVLWTLNSGDWQPVASEILSTKVINEACPGTIILMHTTDSASTTLALPAIITQLKAKGFEFSTISELMSSTNMTARKY